MLFIHVNAKLWSNYACALSIVLGDYIRTKM